MAVRVLLTDAAYYQADDGSFELRQGWPATLTDDQWDAIPENVKLLCDARETVFDPEGGGGGVVLPKVTHFDAEFIETTEVAHDTWTAMPWIPESSRTNDDIMDFTDPAHPTVKVAGLWHFTMCVNMQGLDGAQYDKGAYGSLPKENFFAEINAGGDTRNHYSAEWASNFVDLLTGSYPYPILVVSLNCVLEAGDPVSVGVVHGITEFPANIGMSGQATVIATGVGGDASLTTPFTVADADTTVFLLESGAGEAIARFFASDDSNTFLRSYQWHADGSGSESMLDGNTGGNTWWFLDAYIDQVTPENSYTQLGLQAMVGQTKPLAIFRDQGGSPAFQIGNDGMAIGRWNNDETTQDIEIQAGDVEQVAVIGLARGLYAIDVELIAFDADGESVGQGPDDIYFDIENITTAPSEAALANLSGGSPFFPEQETAHSVSGWFQDAPCFDDSITVPAITHRMLGPVHRFLQVKAGIFTDFNGSAPLYSGSNTPTCTYRIHLTRL